VIRRRDAYETDPDTFLARWGAEDTALRDRIVAARERIGSVDTPDDALRACAELCLALGADGLRGELTLLRAARALAAFEGVAAVDVPQIRAIAPSALRHRLRRDPLDEAGSTARVARVIAEVFGE
jgi:magnesium chelatase subunit I